MKKIALIIGLILISNATLIKSSDSMFKNWQKRFYYNPYTQKLEIKEPWEKVKYFQIQIEE